MTPRASVSLLVLLALSAPALADAVDDGVAAARRAFDEGRKDEALAALRRLHADYPDDDRPIPLLAFAIVDRRGSLAEAADLLSGVLVRRPGDAYAGDLLGIVAERAIDEGKPELARQCAKLLLLDRGNRKEDLYLWAEASYRLGQRDSAREATRRIIADCPSYEPPYWLLAKALEDDGRLEEAVEVYRDLLREQSGNVRARLTRASILLWGLRRYSAAEEEYRSALELAEPGSPLRAEILAGLALVERERARSQRLLRHDRFLTRVLGFALGGWAVVLAAIALALRERRPVVTGS